VVDQLDIEFNHVHVYASDPDRTVTWLTDGLGGEIVRRVTHPGYPEAIAIVLGSRLLVQVRGRRDNEQFASGGPRRYGLDHVGVTVANLDATLEALRERGIEPVTTFEQGFSVPPGVAFLQGPDGLWVEITSSEYEPPLETLLTMEDATES
jgi:catechol 2,3-dioxygenase-like lactoylglutathione lyase family enzyme